MKTYRIFLISLLLFAYINGCDVNDQLYEDVPDSKILFPNERFEKDIFLAPGVNETPIHLYLYRSGMNNDSSDEITINTDESFLEQYNAENNLSLKLLPSSYYSFNNAITISSGEEKGLAEVSVLAEQVVNELDGYGSYGIPLSISAANSSSVHEEKNKIVLQVNIKEPYIRQESYGLEEGVAMGNNLFNKSLNVFVDFENEWDIELGYEVDYSLLEDYNNTNATDYRQFPEENILGIPESFTLASGSNNVEVNLELSTDNLFYFEPYLLPLKLISSSEFPVDPERDIIYLVFTRDFDQEKAQVIPLSSEMIQTYTLESSEGAEENLIDGNTSTYWHSAWSSGVEPLPHWIQINFGESVNIGGVNYTFRQPSGINDRPNHFDVQVSEDGEIWSTVWTSRPGLPVEPVDERQTLVFDQNYSSSFFRIRILDTYASGSWTHLSTLEVFTVTD